MYASHPASKTSRPTLNLDSVCTNSLSLWQLYRVFSLICHISFTLINVKSFAPPRFFARLLCFLVLVLQNHHYARAHALVFRLRVPLTPLTITAVGRLRFAWLGEIKNFISVNVLRATAFGLLLPAEMRLFLLRFKKKVCVVCVSLQPRSKSKLHLLRFGDLASSHIIIFVKLVYSIHGSDLFIFIFHQCLYTNKAETHAVIYRILISV